MTPEERDYYESKSKQDSVTMAAWCLFGIAVCSALAGAWYLIVWVRSLI